jgi:hypothetical protein
VTWEGRGVFEVSSADPDSASPVWVDFTSRIRDVVQAPTLATGRQNDLEQSEPSVFAATLDNVDDALTYGNTSSPYPWWGPGRKCRYRDVIAGTNMPLFTGYLQVPTELQATSGLEQRVQITAVDRLGRLGGGEPFVSTLAEHIKYNAGTTVRGYWPYLETGPPVFREIQQRLPEGRPSKLGGTLATPVAAASVGFGTAPSLFADDATAALFSGGLDASNSAIDAYGVQYLLAASNIVVHAGETVTMVLWIRPENDPPPIPDKICGLFLTQHNLQISRATTGVTLSCFGSFLTGSITMPALSSDQWMPLAIRFGYTPSVFEVWLQGQQIVGTLSGSAPVIELITGIIAPYTFASSVAHVQLYSGDPSGYTFANFQAQYQMGLLGLERQTTGDRIRTIAQYAGIPVSELTQIDSGQSVMQRAQLAGQTPLDAMRDAERTEQGLLYVDGSGNLVFKDRRTLYNI